MTTLTSDVDDAESAKVDRGEGVVRSAGRSPDAAFRTSLDGAARIAAGLVTAPLLRRRTNRWGATDGEVAAEMPGDGWISEPKMSSTRAITISAPPAVVWRWLVQIGHGRGGLYSYEGLENLVGCDLHNADTILPDGVPAVGDLIRLGPDGYPAFRVAELTPAKSFVLVSVDPGVDAGPEQPGQPHGDTMSTWQWQLQPLRGGAATRLLARQRFTYPRRTSALWHVVEPIGFVMERKMLLGIRARAEAEAAGAATDRGHRAAPGGQVVDRITSEDAVSLATDVGPAPMQVGAVLLLDGRACLDPEAVRAAVAERIRSVPRLRQRLVETRFGCGRPIWVDDPDFAIDRHVAFADCPLPGDEESVLGLAAEIIGTRLPADRPLWRMTFVTGVEGDRTAMVIAFHHVLSDGIGGLAVLATLVDGIEPEPADRLRSPMPSTRVLAADAARTRLAALRGLLASFRRVRSVLAQLRPAKAAHPARCSLNRPTGARRRFAVVRVDLDGVRRCAHRHGATVNDVVLTAVTGALHALLTSRGETIDSVVVSVPVSARREADATHLGNEVGVMPLDLPATGDRLARLETIGALTRTAKDAMPAASTSVLGPAFRLLARFGIFRWFINRQRLVHTFVTNLRGPDVELSFLGAPISSVVAVALVTGNVTLSFAVLSYNGTLAITTIADPEACPDLDTLREALQGELDALITSA